MDNMKDKEKLQNLEDKDVEQVSGGADSERKYKGPIPELHHPVALKYGGVMPHKPVIAKYGMPAPKHTDPKLFTQHKTDEDSGEK